MSTAFLFALATAAGLSAAVFLQALRRPIVAALLASGAVALAAAFIAVSGRTYYGRDETFGLALVIGAIVSLTLNLLAVKIGAAARKP